MSVVAEVEASNCNAQAENNSTRNNSSLTIPGTTNEDFIIIENPEFSQQPNPVLLNNTVGQAATGVESDTLPPPRTLDDAPRRKRGRKKEDTSNTKKTLRQKRSKNIKDVLPETFNICLENGNFQSIQLEEIKRNDEYYLPLPTTSEATSSINQKEDIIEVKRSSAYGLRKKIQSKDFSYDIDPFFQEVEEVILSKPYICSECQLCCQTKRELHKHQITAHDHYNCDVCGKDFTTMLGLKRHCHIRHNQAELRQDKAFYMCSESECRFTCAAELEFKQHQFSVHGKDNEHMICGICGKDYTTLLGLQKHIALQHSETECSFCNETFKIGQALIDHVKVCERASVASNFLENKVAKPKLFPCKVCGKKFSERGNRTRHMRIHQGILKFTCDHCGKKCSEKQALLSHIRHIHTGERPYSCSACTRSFATMSDLRRHQLTVHSELRRFSCPDCGKAFKTREGLKTHIKAKAREKLWQCGVCSKKFVTKGNLKTHMVIHSDLKMYECETCQRQFAHKGSLEAHIRVHTGLMPYVCPTCGKKFAHLQNRNRHVRTMHGSSIELE